MQDMKNRSVLPTSETYGLMISCLGAAQAFGKSHSATRYLTRPRGWPVVPSLGEPEKRSATDKVAHLSWDMLSDDSDGLAKKTKFRGFDSMVEEGDEDADEEGEGDFEEALSGSERESDITGEIEGGGGDSSGNPLESSEDALSYQTKLTDQSPAPSILKRVGGDWTALIQKQRAEAQEIILKGEKKRLAKEKSQSEEAPFQDVSSRALAWMLTFDRDIFYRPVVRLNLPIGIKMKSDIEGRGP